MTELEPQLVDLYGKTDQCTCDVDESLLEFGVEFATMIHPKTSCDQSICSRHALCSRWNSRILSIPQSAQSANSPLSSSVYSPSVFQEFEDFRKADWPLVGHGVAHATCGTYWTHVCLEKHDVRELPESIRHQRSLDGQCLKDGAVIQRVKMSCHRPICPTCWTDWRAREVARCKNRFDAMEETFNRNQKRHLKRCHGAISVPKDLWHLSEPDMRKLAMAYLKEVGVVGGSLIYHPKRERKKRRGAWYYSPHFHVYFHAWNAWVDGNLVVKLNKRTGWVFRNFGERDLGKSISYQLSHAGVPPNHGHIVTWFGIMNYRLLHVEKWHGEPQRCPWGHPLDRYGIYVGRGPAPALPDEDGYTAYVAREGWVYLPKAKRRPKDLGDDY